MTKWQRAREFATFPVLGLPIVAGLATYACIRLGISFEMTVEASVFFVGIFFCFGIVMNTADERRFAAFDELAQIKGNLLALSQLAAVWKLSKKDKAELQKTVHNFMEALTYFLQHEPTEKSFGAVDKSLKQMVGFSEIFRAADLPSPEISRLHQFMAQIDFAFEKLAAIKEHRTPQMLRTFLKVTLTISVFVLAPEFADLGYWGIAMSMLITMLLMVLILIQEKIEHPFDEDLDDVSLDFVTRFEHRL